MEQYDIAIIGGGPAGLTAALYARRAGYSAIILEEVAAGGQLAKTDFIENYPGFQEGVEGWKLAFEMEAQAKHFGAMIKNGKVVKLVDNQDFKEVHLSDGTILKALTVIVASGARPRLLCIEGESEFAGQGVSYCATCDGNFFKGKDVAVIGGGNTAVEDALYLSKICNKVYLVHRRDQLRATKIYHERLMEAENVELVWNAIPLEIQGETSIHEKTKREIKSVSTLQIEDVHTKETRSLEVSGVFVAIGMIPNSELAKGAVDINEYGYIVAGEDTCTSVKGIYAAGDVRTKGLRQVVSAVSDGAIAAEKATELLQLH